MLAAAAAAAQTIRPEAVQVAPDSYMVQGLSALGSGANRNFISNAAFVVTTDGVLVIDALGSPALARELLAEIRRITPAPVRYVVLTHYHADHIYGLQVFKDAGATIIAHQDGPRLPELRHRRAAPAGQPRGAGAVRWTRTRAWCRPTAGSTAAPRCSWAGCDFVLQPVGPAHTPEDLVVWVPQLKLLFAGDLVFRGRMPFVGQADSGRWITALDTLLAFDAARHRARARPGCRPARAPTWS